MPIAHFETIITEDEIRSATRLLGRQISIDYRKEAGEDRIVCLGVLSGAFMFMADLIRNISVPVWVEFITASSYKGEMHRVDEPDIRVTDIDRFFSVVKGSNVLIVEDIIDTGFTVNKLIQFVKTYCPKSVKVCTLLNKPSKREVEVPIHYNAFDVDGFVVGYGMDLHGLCRNIGSIMQYEEK